MNKSEIAERARQFALKQPRILESTLKEIEPNVFAVPVSGMLAEFAELEVERAIAESQAPQWISVEERLPDKMDADGEWNRVQLIRNGEWTAGYRQDARYWRDELDVDNDGVPYRVSIKCAQVTHWMPLSASPKGNENV